MVHVEFTPQAIEDLAQLDSGIADRIAAKVPEKRRISEL
jgi:mRNA-degrading endonuclease RelE of RelBE toxin-antitoxin system